MRWWVWLSAPLAPVFLIAGWTVAQSRQPPGYDPVRDTISALAARHATDAWIMTSGLAALGACHLLTAYGFAAADRVARICLAVGGAATVLVAASPQPSPTHVPAAAVAFVALAIWPALAGRRVRWGRAASILLVVVLVWFGASLATASLLGLSERVLAGAEALVPVALLVATSRVRRTTA